MIKTCFVRIIKMPPSAWGRTVWETVSGPVSFTNTCLFFSYYETWDSWFQTLAFYIFKQFFKRWRAGRPRLGNAVELGAHGSELTT